MTASLGEIPTDGKTAASVNGTQPGPPISDATPQYSDPEHEIISILYSYPKKIKYLYLGTKLERHHFTDPVHGCVYGAMSVLSYEKKTSIEPEDIRTQLISWTVESEHADNALTAVDAVSAINEGKYSNDSYSSDTEALIRAKYLADEIKSAASPSRPATSQTQENEGLAGLAGSYPDTFENFTEDPQRITPELRPVPSLPAELIPEPFRDWLTDIAARVGCPLEYGAASAICALTATIGRKVGARPKRHDDWTVLANLWGAIIGTPGAKKTPSSSEARKPLRRLMAEAIDAHQAALSEWEMESSVSEFEEKALKHKMDKAARGGASRADLMQMLATEKADAPEPPTLKRYEVNDATIEALGERLKENPNGLLLYRDELTGFIKSLDRQGHENDRAFYLEAWNGSGEYTYDRIGRGTIHIPSVCLSIFGTIQPAPLARLLRGAANGNEADGFVPRFQMMLYPDPVPYKLIDRYPDTEAKNRAWEIFKRLDAMTPADIGAETEDGQGIPFLRFDLKVHDGECAQELLNKWMHELETERLPASQENPLIESHLAKFRSLMPKLALIFHLVDVADGQEPGPISLKATRMAAAWCELLEAHAKRVYSLAYDTPIDSALALAEKIKGGDLSTLQSWDGKRFKVRDVVKKGWATLSTTEEALRAIAILESRHWLQLVEEPPSPQGGRPAEWVYVHPEFSEEGEAA